MFKFFYILTFLCTIIFGDIVIAGNIIVRYIAVFTMFLVCCLQNVRYPRKTAYYIYFAFIFLFFFTSLINGYEIDFVKVFFGSYFVSIIWIWATYILIVKYDSIQTLINTLIIVSIINAIITIAQYYKNPIAFSVSLALNVLDQYSVTALMDNSGASETLSGYAMYGLFGAVPNGYYSAVGSVLILYWFYKSKDFIRRITSIGLWLLLLFGLFCIQERAALVGGAFFSVLLFLKFEFSNKKTIVPFVLFLVIAAFYIMYKGPDVLSFTEGTRYESFDLESRSSIFSTSHEYLFSKPFTANLFDYINIYHNYPHHLVYYSFMCGAFLGGVIILGLLVYILFHAYKCSRKVVCDNNIHIIILSFALFAYVVPSLTHNDSIASGAVLFWVLAAPILTKSTALFKKNEIVNVTKTESQVRFDRTPIY